MHARRLSRRPPSSRRHGLPSLSTTIPRQRDALPIASRVNRQVNWRAAPQPKVAAAALSIALTAALFVVFNEAPRHHVGTRTRAVTVWVPPAHPALRDDARTLKSPRRGSKSPATSIAGPQRSIQEPLSDNVATLTESPATASHVQNASASLRLQLLNSGGQETKSSIRSMAERPRTYIGDTPASEQDRWSKSVERAAKPDCLAPNEHGSLLSAFMLAYDAFRGRCN